MKILNTITVLASLSACAAFAQDNAIEKFDPRMALEKATVDTNGVKWIDGRYLPLEGKCFSNTSAYYDRLPSNVTENVNGGVRGMKSHTSGMQFRFVTDSRRHTVERREYYLENTVLTVGRKLVNNIYPKEWRLNDKLL